jgi:hypothetical protein
LIEELSEGWLCSVGISNTDVWQDAVVCFFAIDVNFIVFGALLISIFE